MLKRSIIFSILFLPVLLYGQVINHFDNPDSKWYVAKNYADADIEHPSFVSIKTTVFGNIGDSLINGKKWRKIYSTQDKDFQTDLKYCGLTRSEDGKVFYLDTLNQLDTLYDFNTKRIYKIV